ncbi:MAG: hypothetical protein Q7U97_04940 [Rhodocyclaceae bacterium]|nr:hypothetical protein [Rhodocyclaceae bacterium]
MSRTSTAELYSLAVQFAQDHAFLADPDEAAGRCFWAALRFAWVADDHGHQVEVIRWRLANDPDYNDHWAVILQGNQVIDHTRAQVDGQAGIFWRTSQYPANYFAPRRYPASLLLTHFQRQQHEADGQFGPGYMASVKARLAEFDAGRYPAPPIPVHGWGLLALAFAFLAWRVLA